MITRDDMLWGMGTGAAIGLLVLAFFALSGCAPVAPIGPDPDATSSAPEARRGTCAAACANMARLGCEAASPTPEGDSCEDVCKSVQASGIVKFDLGCRATASTCAKVDACER
jgi:hypothetical protein